VRNLVLSLSFFDFEILSGMSIAFRACSRLLDDFKVQNSNSYQGNGFDFILTF